MEAKELRIGNYLKDKEGLIVKVKGLDSERQFKHQGALYLGTAQCYYREYSGTMGKWLQTLQPIPLSEEILLKCGFYECKNGIEIELNYGIKLNCLFGSNIITLEIYESRCKTDIKYLHQLQNLYFAITGKELEVKL